jgi:hypothetical protein
MSEFAWEDARYVMLERPSDGANWMGLELATD